MILDITGTIGNIHGVKDNKRPNPKKLNKITTKLLFVNNLSKSVGAFACELEVI
jgi:hypothetical protein